MLDGGEWRRDGVIKKHSALRAGIFKAWGSTDPMGVLESAEARAPRSGHRLDEPARLSRRTCIPAVPASVLPGEIIVTSARGQQTLRPSRCGRLGLPRCEEN